MLYVIHLSEEGCLNTASFTDDTGGARIITQFFPLHVSLNNEAIPSPNMIDTIVRPVFECKNRSKCIYYTILYNYGCYVIEWVVF